MERRPFGISGVQDRTENDYNMPETHPVPITQQIAYSEVDRTVIVDRKVIYLKEDENIFFSRLYRYAHISVPKELLMRGVRTTRKSLTPHRSIVASLRWLLPDPNIIQSNGFSGWRLGGPHHKIYVTDEERRKLTEKEKNYQQEFNTKADFGTYEMDQHTGLYVPSEAIYSVNGEDSNLEATEQNLFEYLWAHEGQVLSAKALNMGIWNSAVSDSAVRVIMSRLKRKIERDPEHPLIRQTQGKGYVFSSGGIVRRDFPLLRQTRDEKVALAHEQYYDEEERAYSWRGGSITYFIDEARIRVNGEDNILTGTLQKLLEFFATNAGLLISVREILDQMWEDCTEVSGVRRDIYLLRKALGDNPNDPKLLINVPGKGYIFHPRESKKSK